MNIKEKIIIVAIGSIVFGCADSTNLEPQINTKELVKSETHNFQSFLGSEKYHALELIVQSFDSFLSLNFDSLDTREGRILAYLSHMDESGCHFLDSWKHNEELSFKAIEAYENSKLRQDIWHYEFENPGSNQTNYRSNYGHSEDSAWVFTDSSLFSIALANHGQPDSIWKPIAPHLLSNAPKDAVTIAHSFRNSIEWHGNDHFFMLIAIEMYVAYIYSEHINKINSTSQ